MYKNVTVMSYLFEEIDKNMKYYVERRETHTKIISNLIDTVKQMTYYKGGIILTIFIVQIMILRRLILNSRLNYKI